VEPSAFEGLHAHRVAAECDARNLAARGLLAKATCGQESERMEDSFSKGGWVNTVGFALLKKEYQGRQPEAMT